MEEAKQNGWSEWGKYVLKELERLNDCYDEQGKLIQSMRVEIAMLKVKSGIWGLLAGAIPATLALIYTFLKSK